MNRLTKLTCTALGILSASVAFAESPNVLFVLDGSGSMWGQVDNQPKISIAKEVMTNLINDLPDSVRPGLQVYGHRRKGDCNDIEIMTPVGQGDKQTLVKQIQSIKPKGKTPITKSLQMAADQLRASEDETTVVLISDGKETCNADPCALVRELRDSGVKVQVHVVGFDVSKEEKEQLLCIAEQGGGEYFSADNTAQLNEVLAIVKEEVIKKVAASSKQKTDGIIWEDYFDRKELGNEYVIDNLDNNRLMLDGESVISITDHPPKNTVTLLKNFTEDIIATIKVEMNFSSLGFSAYNYAGLYMGYRGRGGNYVFTGLISDEERRGLEFSKIVNQKWETVVLYDDELDVFSENIPTSPGSLETWYFQIEKRGNKFIARASLDGENWKTVGDMNLLSESGVFVGFEMGNGHEKKARGNRNSI